MTTYILVASTLIATEFVDVPNPIEISSKDVSFPLKETIPFPLRVRGKLSICKLVPAAIVSEEETILSLSQRDRAGRYSLGRYSDLIMNFVGFLLFDFQK